MRHSRAMHQLEDGVNLFYVRNPLGQSFIEATQTYANADREDKRQHIMRAGAKIMGDVPDHDGATRDEPLAWLKSEL